MGLSNCRLAASTSGTLFTEGGLPAVIFLIASLTGIGLLLFTLPLPAPALVSGASAGWCLI